MRRGWDCEVVIKKLYRLKGPGIKAGGRRRDFSIYLSVPALGLNSIPSTMNKDSFPGG